MVLSDNKRIAFNSAVIYVKLVLSMIIGLYTSRIVLSSLGASDYGLYTLIGGIVTMMNFFGSSMTSVTNRYILIEMGKGEAGDCNKVFNTALLIHVFIALILVVVGETFGVWYISKIANINIEKIEDAVYVLHMSMFACVFSIISVPYNGLIIAREKFVYTSFIELMRTVIKLLFVLWLCSYLGNRLRFFSVIMCVFNVILPISFFIYCYIKDKEIIKFKINKNLKDYWDMLKFSLGMAIGALACIGQTQFSHMVINIFFGTVLNAAYGIANTVNSYMMMFVKSFNQAAVPQIMKNIENNSARTVALVYTTTRFSFFIFIIPVVPLLLNLNYVLHVWLGNVPPFTAIFASILLLTGLVRTLGAGFDATIQATGRIWLNQFVYSVIYLSVVPIAYILYKCDFPVCTINIIIMIAAIFVLAFQVLYVSTISDLTVRGYVKQTLKPAVMVAISLIPLFCIKVLFNENVTFFLLSSAISVLWVIISVYFIGCTTSERMLITNSIKKIMK